MLGLSSALNFVTTTGGAGFVSVFGSSFGVTVVMFGGLMLYEMYKEKESPSPSPTTMPKWENLGTNSTILGVSFVAAVALLMTVSRRRVMLPDPIKAISFGLAASPVLAMASVLGQMAWAKYKGDEWNPMKMEKLWLTPDTGSRFSNLLAGSAVMAGALALLSGAIFRSRGGTLGTFTSATLFIALSSVIAEFAFEKYNGKLSGWNPADLQSFWLQSHITG